MHILLGKKRLFLWISEFKQDTCKVNLKHAEIITRNLTTK